MKDKILKIGDIIYLAGSNSLALVTDIREHDRGLWVSLLDDDGIFEDDLVDGYFIVDEHFDWPIWHDNHIVNDWDVTPYGEQR